MRKRLWLRLVVLAVALLLFASWGVSSALEYGWARRSLLARLEESFGRPVEVGHFGFSLMSGPKLEADSVSVAEDPRFGQEYFLRAEKLTAVLRWTGLLRGRIEFGSLSLTAPSLNLVRNADGHWNIESWLPPFLDARTDPGSPPPADSETTRASDSTGNSRSPSSPARRLDHIEVDGGRINFKRQSDKLPFALVGVSGQLEQDVSGRWSLDLTADPMRTSVALQEAGTLRLRGTVSGTSAGLRPANLVLTWEQVSLADALRLAGGRDYGVRGGLGAEFSVKIAEPGENPVEKYSAALGEEVKIESSPPRATPAAIWTIAGIVRFEGVHRWDLSSRTTDPAVTANFVAVWQPGRSRLEVTRYVLESPRSRLDAVGNVDWSNGFRPYVQIASSHIAFDDLLAWRRAFGPATADDLTIEGTAGVEGIITDWPPRFERADIASQGAVVHVGALGVVRVGPMEAKLDRGSLILSPVEVSLPAATVIARGSRSNATAAAVPAFVAGGTLRVDGVLGPLRSGRRPGDWEYRVAVSGDTQRAQDLVAASSAFGRPTNADWSIDGPATIHLVWRGALRHGTSSTTGTVELQNLRLNTVLTNRPMFISATVELRLGEQHVNIRSAQAFDTNWKGSLDRRTVDREWNFDLSADRLDTAQLDPWLGSAARPGMLDRILPFAPSTSQTPTRGAALEGLEARGRLRVADVALASLHIEMLDTAVEIHGRDLFLRGARAAFYGGRATGDFEARLEADPAYTVHAQIDRTNLASVVAATASLGGQAGGLASGMVHLAAHGVGRENLLASLEGDGDLRIREPMVSGSQPHEEQPHGSEALPETAAEEAQTTNEKHFGTGTVAFHIDHSHIRLNQLVLLGREEQFQVDGSVDFGGQLDLRVLSMPRGGDPSGDAEASAAGGVEWALGGTLAMPQWTRQTKTAVSGAAPPRAHSLR